MKNRRKKPGVKLTRAQKKKLEELTRQAKADGRHPNSAQKTIPYLSMYKDGLCRVTENYYTMSLLFDDMNYDLEDEAEQLGIFGGWCSFYSYFDCAVHVQMTGINSENDPEAFARALAVLERNEAYRALCAEYVQLLQTQYMRSNNGQTRIKLMTFGIESESVKGARSRLTRIGLDMQGNFKKIGVESVLMDGKERLSLLHALFHMDDHTPFVFEWSWLPETGLSTKDFIAPGSFDFSPSRSFKIGETYCAASYIQIQTSSLSKKLLGELLRLPSSAVFSLHVQPMDQMTAIKLIKQKQVVLDATKISEQQKAFRSGYDIDIIPRDIDAYGDDTKRLLQTLGTNEKLYMATIVVMNMAGSKKEKFIGGFYDKKEVNTLFDIIQGNPLEVAIKLAAFYGLRREEIIGLKWNAIDFENSTLTIQHTVTECNLNGKHIEVASDTAKTDSSLRTMPLVANFREMLLAKKEKQEYYRKLCGRSYCKEYLDYIFVNEMGERLKPSYLSDGFKRILEQNDLRRIRFHDLRHTCASLLLANNVPMKKIQEWLGHSDFSTTANIYAHLDYQSKISSAEAMLTGLGMN